MEFKDDSKYHLERKPHAECKVIKVVWNALAVLYMIQLQFVTLQSDITIKCKQFIEKLV